MLTSGQGFDERTHRRGGFFTGKM